MQNGKILIGLGHKKGRGKTEAAKCLADYLQLDICSFASRVKQVAALCAFGTHHMHEAWRIKKNEQLFNTQFADITGRQMLQGIGAALRNGFCSSFWIRALNLPRLLGETTSKGIVVDDVRYPNEAEHIRQLGGILVRIDRVAATVDMHETECALDDYTGWDIVINNNKSIEELRSNVLRAVVSKTLCLYAEHDLCNTVAATAVQPQNPVSAVSS